MQLTDASIWSFSRHVPLGGDPGADPELAEETIKFLCLGNAADHPELPAMGNCISLLLEPLGSPRTHYRNYTSPLSLERLRSPRNLQRNCGSFLTQKHLESQELPAIGKFVFFVFGNTGISQKSLEGQLVYPVLGTLWIIQNSELHVLFWVGVFYLTSYF